MAEKLHLHFLQSDQPPYEVSPQSPVIVGRSGTCDVDLTRYFRDSLGTVSREHVKIFYENECFFIVDLGSRHGTRVSGYPLARDEARSLWNDDRIEIAGDKDLTIVVKIDRGPDATEPLPTDLSISPILKPLGEFRDVFLLGIAGTGKTTLLRKLIHYPETQNAPGRSLSEHRYLLFCYVNCMAIDDPSCSSFFRLLIAATKPAFYDWPAAIRRSYDSLSTADCSIDEIAAAMLETIQTVQRYHRKRIVFLLDQFDDVCNQLPSEIFLVLKEIKLSSEPHPIYIIAMRNELEENKNIEQFLRSMHARYDYWMQPLPDDKLEDAINPYRLEPEKVRMSVRLGGGQPRLTDLIAASIARMSRTPTGEKAIVKQLLADRSIVNHCQEMWNSLLSDEQTAMQSVASGAPRMKSVIQDRLTRNKWLLTDETQDLTFITPLFDAYVQSQLRETNLSADGQARYGLLVDEGTSEFIIDGKRIQHEDLTKLERDLLSHLYEKAGRVCTYADISSDVWGYDEFKSGASTDMIARVIHELRKKLDEKSPESGTRHIKNVRGQGYKYVVK